MFSRLLGVFLVIVGVVMIIFSEWMLENFGRIAWAENKLGTEGGTRLFYKILGLLGIFFGMTLVLGMFEGLVLWVFSPLMPK